MDNISPEVWVAAHTIISRAESANSTLSNATSTPHRPPIYKAIGLTLAVASGLFIGTSFVLKKTGLLKANAKYNEEAGEGYGYLKNAYWWTGMTLMIVGEICNFVAYAFVDAILVTPLGALSVVVTTVLSAIFLKERLSFVGKVGCFNCIIGSVVIVMNAPEQSAVADIQEMKHFVIAPGFLSYAGVIIVGCAFIAFYVGPRYGKKSMLVYLSICSLIGGLSVVATQGLGSAVVAQAGGKPQFNQWFLYVLLVFVAATLITEIIFLNKALNLFNAALVTPTYYVFFTSATIVTSAVLFRGFHGTPVSIATVIMGFLQICTGVVLLQMSKSAKDVPDAAVFRGDLDQVREIGEQEQPETEPKADAIRGTAALIRRISVSRQKMEQEEARRLREDRLKDQLEPLKENEIVEWDGLRRRKTIIGQPGSTSSVRRKSTHPPLGMSRIPDPEEDLENGDEQDETGFFQNLRYRAQSVIHPGSKSANSHSTQTALQSPMHPVALTDIKLNNSKVDTPILPYGPGSFEEAQEHIYGLPPGFRKAQDQTNVSGGAIPSPRSKPLPAKPTPSPSLQPSNEARRQFSFNNFFHRNSRTPFESEIPTSSSRIGIGSRTSSHETRHGVKNATEEERLGLVKGDSNTSFFENQESQTPDHPKQRFITQAGSPTLPQSHSSSITSIDDKYRHQDPTMTAVTTSSTPYRHTRQSSFSDSDEDNSWQMANRATQNYEKIQTTTPNPSPQQQLPKTKYQRPSPPRTYQPPQSIKSIPGQTNVVERKPVLAPVQSSTVNPEHTLARAMPAAMSSDLSPNSSTNPIPTSIQRNESEGLRGNSKEGQSFGENLLRFASPEDYDSSGKRFEEQNRREREERRQRAGLKK